MVYSPRSCKKLDMTEQLTLDLINKSTNKYMEYKLYLLFSSLMCFHKIDVIFPLKFGYIHSEILNTFICIYPGFL